MINDSTDTTTFPRFISWSESGANYVVIYYNITTGVPAAGTTINIYYGNSAATNPDSGSNVFKQFYGFEGDALPDGWTSSGTGTVAVSGGNVRITQTPSQSGYLQGPNITAGNVMMMSFRASTCSYGVSGDGASIREEPNEQGGHCMLAFNDGLNRKFVDEGVGWGSAIESLSTGTWYMFEAYESGTSLYARKNYATTWNSYTVGAASSHYLKIYYLTGTSGNGDYYIDWVAERYKTASEPADGGWNTGSTVSDMVQTVKFSIVKIDPLGLYLGSVSDVAVYQYDANRLLLNTKQTGTDGSVSYTMYRSTYYQVQFLDTDKGINKTWTGYPSETEYVVYVWPWELEWTPGKAGTDDEYKKIVSYMTAQLNESDNNDGDITAYYNDTGAHTATTTVSVYKRLNMTNDLLVDSYTTSDNNFSHLFTVSDVSGEDYKVVITASNSYYGVVNRTFTWTFPGVRYNIPGLPLMAYVWIGFIVPVFVALTVSMRNVKFGPIVFCAMSWGFNTLGWMSQLGTGYTLVLAVATFFSVLYIFNQKAREGGY
jgi:roadblock/LC7 domain-containing protein